MTRVSFYILKGIEEHERQSFACRLAEKAFKMGNHIYINAESEQQAQQMDKALWAFRADSFVPHQLLDEKTANHNQSQILIGHSATKPPRLMDLLINIASGEQPEFFSQFERVAELVNDDEKIKTDGRARYKFYKHRGYELNAHNVSA